MTNAEVSAPLQVSGLSFFHLAFKNRTFEDAYLARMQRESRNWLVGGFILGIGMMLLIMLASPPDEPTLSVAGRHTLDQLRFAVWAPTFIGGIVGNIFLKRPRILVFWIAGLCTYSGVCLAIFAAPGGNLSIETVASLTMVVLLFFYFFTGLPFRWAASVAMVTHASQIIAVMILHPGDRTLIEDTIIIAVTSGIMGFLAYRLERASRENFFAQDQLQTEYRHRLTAERDRIRWLENVTGFLRHELKNAMTGIGSSLDLAEQTTVDRGGAEYLGRAKRSLDFMRRFLQQASEATSLETALAEQELEPVNFSQLVEGRVRDYGEEITGRTFAINVEPGICVMGNADRLVQMLDKLANNAVEHGAAEYPVEVKLRTEGGRAVLSVRDVGEMLPNDLDRMFEPFVSQKLQHGKGNLGLGLHVARVIAIRHGGTIEATRLKDPDGAELTVELPRYEGNVLPT